MTSQATVALALEPAICIVHWQDGEAQAVVLGGPEVLWRSETGPAINMGQGLVAQEVFSDWVSHASREIQFQHCESGRTLVVLTRSLQAPDINVVVEPDPYAVMRDALLSDYVFTLAEVAGMFSWARVVGSDGTESCGCAVFYPEQRGAKTPFEH